MSTTPADSATSVEVDAQPSSTCPCCLDLLRFPVTLPCSHSLCKSCALTRFHDNGGGGRGRGDAPHTRATSGSGGSTLAATVGDGSGSGGGGVTCPQCHRRAYFPSESAMKINTPLQTAVEILKGELLVKTPCMRCEAVEATVDCPECNAKYCSACSDLIHVGKLRAHRVAYNAAAVQAIHKPAYCTQLGHEDYRTDLFCADCKTMLCVICSQVSPLHRSHVVVPLSEAADIERGKLQQTLGNAAKFRTSLKNALGVVDDAIARNVEHVSREVESFDRMMAQLLQRMQERRIHLIENAQLLSEGELSKLRTVRAQIYQLAAALNETMAASQRALAMGTNTAILKGCVEMESQLAQSEPILIPDAFLPEFHVQPAAAQILQSVEMLSVSLSTDADVDAQLVETGHIFHSRGFHFVKSTFNELHFSNRGQTVSSKSGSSWETAMCNELLSSGTVYFEVQLMQYTPVNGHNVIVGFVFDGAYELCEVLGEDVHSVGFDLGRGTKCVGGDYFLPYAQEAACTQGDVVGVKIDFDLRNVTFYKNGRNLGVAFTGVNRPCYAAVSLCDAQKVQLRFPMKVPL